MFEKVNPGHPDKMADRLSGVVPSVDDLVVIHYGDENEHAESYRVRLRVIDGTRPDYIKLFIERLQD